jgi:hypothetical protein
MIYVYLKSGKAVELSQARSASYLGRELICFSESGNELARFPRDEVSNFSERDLRAILAQGEAEEPLMQRFIEHT